MSTTGYQDLVVKYETRRSGSGAGTQNVSYTINGTDFIPFQAVTVTETPVIITLDFSAIADVDNNANFAVRFEFEIGGGGDGGNNRFDNLTAEGDDFGGEVDPIPGATEILQPADEATDVGLRPVFEWSESEHAASYTLQVSVTHDFSSIVTEQKNITGISKQLTATLEENTIYFWRVRGQNSTGNGEWSEAGSFTTVEVFESFDIHLNEVMASNKNVVTDEDEDFSDWIEIYNQGEETLSLNGFGLSDDALDPFKWTFPDVAIEPGEFILVWASDKNRSVAGEPYHTNFKIGAEGESIILTSADGVALDVSPAVAMEDDQSYGRFPNGRGDWGFTEEPTPGEANAAPPLPFSITTFKFQTQYNHGHILEDIVCDIYGDSLIVGIIPYQQEKFKLKATFSAGSASSVTVDGDEQESNRTKNDFSTPVFYTISSGENSKTYEVRLVYTGLPVIYVYTNGGAPIVSKDDYVGGQVKVYPNEDAMNVFAGPLQIRGRGNSTWTLPKKPYRIKLAAAASMLGMPSDRDWVLLANYSDKTLARNAIAFHLGQHSSHEYTTRSTHVELVLNGVYQGNYLFGEHVKVADHRVSIDELEEDDAPGDGGYFLEIDARLDGEFWFKTTDNVPIVMKSPEEPSEAQFEYIKTYIQDMEDAIYSENFADPVEGYRKYIKTETLIDWYWINELYRNRDASFFSSIYMYKDKDEKLNMGPLWDFDIGAGNDEENGDPTGWYIREAKWMKRLFEDPAFKQEAEARWVTLKQELFDDLPGAIDDLASKLELSQQLNFRKWDILNTWVWPNAVVTGSYQGEINYLKSWLETRTAWIDEEIILANQPPPPPTLFSPEDGIVGESLTPVLKWFKVDRAGLSHLQVSTDEDFNELIVDESGIADTIYSILTPLNNQTVYYWRVSFTNPIGEGDWSDVWSFTTVVNGIEGDISSVSLYPNPAEREIYIDVPSSVSSLEILDMIGRTKLAIDSPVGRTVRVDTSEFPRGMYIVRLSGKTNTLSKKVILR